jgi:predicted O-methyltransferase YrrM
LNALDLIASKYAADLSAPSPIGLRISRHRELLDLWRELGYLKLAEIGTEAGRFAEEICVANPDAHLTCVDPYLAYDLYEDHREQSRMDHFYAVAKHRLDKYRVTIRRKTSLEAVHEFPNGYLDAIFIDGNHHFDYVVQDIIAWAPKVRRGGMVAGHDYKPEGREKRPIPFGVIEAVDGYTHAHKVKHFFLTKRDKCPSWFWIKE